MKKFTLGILAVLALFAAIFFLGMMYTSCGSVKPLLNDPEELAEFESCATKCGSGIALDMLACPLNGGGWKDLVTSQVAQGLAESAGTCILSCLTDVDIDVSKAICESGK